MKPSQKNFQNDEAEIFRLFGSSQLQGKGKQTSKNQGRLQTGEHILAKVIENKFPGTKVIIVSFDDEKGRLDVLSETDLRTVSIEELENETNEIIEKGLEVKKTIFKREEIEKEFNLSKIPENVKEIRIVDIVGFDKRPCRDPHVDNTKDIGYFKILKVERKGKDRYRFEFEVGQTKGL